MSRLAIRPVPHRAGKGLVLAAAIDLDEGTCSHDLFNVSTGYFGLGLAPARIIIAEVTAETRTWRDLAGKAGAQAVEIDRMANSFEHDDLERALRLKIVAGFAIWGHFRAS